MSRDEGLKELLAGNHSAAARALTAHIEQNAVTDPMVFCNRAAAYFELGLFRNVLKDANAAIARDATCLRAYWWKCRALLALGKRGDARVALRAGVESGGGWGDVVVLQELLLLDSQCGEPAGNSGSVSDGDKSEAPQVQRVKEADTSELQRNLDQVAQTGVVQFGIGNAEIDKQIALGYWHTNSAHYKEAIALFSALLKMHPKVVAAFLGRGTALAMSGRLKDAVSDFSQAATLDPKCIDAFKRRGQSLLALNEHKLAMHDFDVCVALSPGDADSRQQRGICFYKMRDFFKAKDAFEEATRSDPTLRDAWNHLGLTLNQLGRSRDAVAAHETAAALEPSHAESWTNMGQSHKECGDFARADEAFSKSLALQPANAHAHWLRGMARYLAGHHLLAMRDLRVAMKLNGDFADVRNLMAVALAARGRFGECVKECDALLSKLPDHHVWYTRRLALVAQKSLKRPFAEYCLDALVEDVVKEGHCKRKPARLACSAQYAKDLEFVAGREVEQSPLDNNDRDALAKVALSFGPRFQYNTPGFVVNKRQWTSAGLAIVQMAQLLVSDATAGWRQMFEVAVRWRQVSEPNDPVWWVDRLPFVQFCEGYGSHTPIVTGQCQTVRYGSQLERALALVKSLICSRPELTPTRRREVEAAGSLADLYSAMRRDFWVTTACHSSERPGKIMEGTRLTLQCTSGGTAGGASPGTGIGYEFSIRTPGTPHRFAEFCIELDLLWKRLRDAMASLKEGCGSQELVLEAALRVVFFWYNLMPLSRGTAAIGSCALHGILLSCGLVVKSPVPEGYQPDWDAILSPTAQEFCERMKQWIQLEPVDFSTFPVVTKVVATVEDAFIILNTTAK